MEKAEAIERAKLFIKTNGGIEGDPVSIRLVRKGGGATNYWRIMFGAEVMFSNDIAQGATVDGGEYILDVDERSGEITVFA